MVAGLPGSNLCAAGWLGAARLGTPARAHQKAASSSQGTSAGRGTSWSGCQGRPSTARSFLDVSQERTIARTPIVVWHQWQRNGEHFDELAGVEGSIGRRVVVRALGHYHPEQYEVYGR